MTIFLVKDYHVCSQVFVLLLFSKTNQYLMDSFPQTDIFYLLSSPQNGLIPLDNEAINQTLFAVLYMLENLAEQTGSSRCSEGPLWDAQSKYR
jgi:hypothetical protein